MDNFIQAISSYLGVGEALKSNVEKEQFWADRFAASNDAKRKLGIFMFVCVYEWCLARAETLKSHGLAPEDDDIFDSVFDHPESKADITEIFRIEGYKLTRQRIHELRRVVSEIIMPAIQGDINIFDVELGISYYTEAIRFEYGDELPEDADPEMPAPLYAIMDACDMKAEKPVDGEQGVQNVPVWKGRLSSKGLVLRGSRKQLVGPKKEPDAGIISPGMVMERTCICADCDSRFKLACPECGSQRVFLQLTSTLEEQ